MEFSWENAKLIYDVFANFCTICTAALALRFYIKIRNEKLDYAVGLNSRQKEIASLTVRVFDVKGKYSAVGINELVTAIHKMNNKFEIGDIKDALEIFSGRPFRYLKKKDAKYSLTYGHGSNQPRLREIIS